MIPRHIRLLLALLFLPALSYGQTTVTGHVRVPDPTVAAVNAKVCVTLINFKPNVARVIGTGQIINTTNYCVTPAVDGSYSFSIYGNNVISPTATNWRVDWLFNGIQTASATYLINHSPFNLDTETPLSSSTPAGPNQLLLNVFPFTQLTPSLTWTIPHNFNDSNTIAVISGLNGNDIYPDTKNCRNDANNCIITFVTPTSGFAIAMHAAAINIATSQPNAVVQNPVGSQTIGGTYTTTGAGFHGGIETFTGLMQCRNFESVRCVDSANTGAWTGATSGDWINSAYADFPAAGGVILAAPGLPSYSTDISFNVNGKTGFLRCPAPSAVFGASTGSNLLNYTGSGTALNMAAGAGGGAEGCQLTGPSAVGSTVGLYSNFSVKQIFRDLDISGFGIGLKLNSAANQSYLNTFSNLQLHDNGTNLLLPTGAAGTENTGIDGGTISNTGSAYNAASVDLGSGAEVHFNHVSFDQAGVTLRGTNPKMTETGGHHEDPGGTTTSPLLTFDTSTAAGHYSSFGVKWVEDFNSGRNSILKANGSAGGNILSAGDLIHSTVNPLPCFIDLGATNVIATVIGDQSDGATVTNWICGGLASLILNPTLVSHNVTGTNTFNCQLSGGVGCVITYRGSTSGNTVLQGSAVASGVLTLPAATDTLVGKATTDTLTNKTLTAPSISSPTIAAGVAADGSGFKHKRTTAGCATAASAGATCTTTIPWTTTFVDGSSTPVCNGFGVTSGVPLNGGITAIVGASVTFQTVAGTAAAAQYTNIACIAVHD